MAAEVYYQRPIGESDSTYEGKKTAIRLFNLYQGKRNAPAYNELTVDDVEQDNLQFIIKRFASWLANFDMPRYHDANFEPRSSAVGKLATYMEAGTKRKYLERIKAVLKETFPRHPDWADQNEWYLQLLVNFDTEAKRNKSKIDNSDVSDRSIRSLYKENTPGKVAMTRDLDKFHMLDTIDLTYICKKVCDMIYINNDTYLLLSCFFYSYAAYDKCWAFGANEYGETMSTNNTVQWSGKGRRDKVSAIRGLDIRFSLSNYRHKLARDEDTADIFNANVPRSVRICLRLVSLTWLFLCS